MKNTKRISALLIIVALMSVNISSVMAYEVTTWSTYYNDSHVNQTTAGCNIRRYKGVHGAELTKNSSQSYVKAKLVPTNCRIDLSEILMRAVNDKKYFYVTYCSNLDREYFTVYTSSDKAGMQFYTEGRIWY